MDLIYQAAAKYVALQQYEYEFVLSHRRKTRKIKLSFSNKEFFHLAGLQHLTDIQIPRNKNKTLDYILFSRAITDETIGKSKFFREKIPEGNIKSRIEELRFLEEYLDTDNIIKIFSIKNQRYLSSLIDADYIIESQISPGITVYIFLKCINDATGECKLISFFKKENIAYGGDILYWMMKTKHNIFTDKNIILYKHPNYSKEE